MYVCSIAESSLTSCCCFFYKQPWSTDWLQLERGSFHMCFQPFLFLHWSWSVITAQCCSWNNKPWQMRFLPLHSKTPAQKAPLCSWPLPETLWLTPALAQALVAGQKQPLCCPLFTPSNLRERAWGKFNLSKSDHEYFSCCSFLPPHLIFAVGIYLNLTTFHPLRRSSYPVTCQGSDEAQRV